MNRCYWCILGLHAHAIYSDVISFCTERVLFGNTVDHFRRSWIYYSFSIFNSKNVRKQRTKAKPKQFSLSDYCRVFGLLLFWQLWAIIPIPYNNREHVHWEYSHAAKNTNTVQMVQRRAARWVLNRFDRSDSVTENAFNPDDTRKQANHSTPILYAV